jgi:hypothetical protein
MQLSVVFLDLKDHSYRLERETVDGVGKYWATRKEDAFVPQELPSPALDRKLQ